MDLKIYTIGHSTHPIDEFIKILKVYGIELLVDIRTIPRSRVNPQFNEPDLRVSLKEKDIEYFHSMGLGGLRHTTKASINTAWKNSSFRGFADYMQTEEFQAGLEQLLEFARRKLTVIMCAESVPWRCHRSLVGDALLVRDVHVEDIYGEKNSKFHKLTPWAKVNGNNITYPSEAEQPIPDR